MVREPEVIVIVLVAIYFQMIVAVELDIHGKVGGDKSLRADGKWDGVVFRTTMWCIHSVLESDKNKPDILKVTIGMIMFSF